MRHHLMQTMKWCDISAFSAGIPLNWNYEELDTLLFVFFSFGEKWNVTAQIERSMHFFGVVVASVDINILLFFSFLCFSPPSPCIAVVLVVVEQNGKFPIGYEIRIGIREHICSRQTLVIVHTTEKLNGPSNRSIHLSHFLSSSAAASYTNQFCK